MHASLLKSSGALAFALLASIPLRASGAYFALPPQCTQGATGSDYGGDPLYGGVWPSVSVSFVQGSQNVYIPNVSLTPGADGSWTYAFNPPKVGQGDTYLVVATYTPFLQSYVGVTPINPGLATGPLPPAGSITHSGSRLVAAVTIALPTSAQSNAPLANGFLEMAPDFPGSSPYTLQADANGNVTIACFTILSGGNYGTVSSSDGYYAYDAKFTFDANGSAAVSVLQGE